MLKRFFFRTIILAFVLAGHFTGHDGFINVVGFSLVIVLTPCATLVAFSNAVQRKLADAKKAPGFGELESFARIVIRVATVLALVWFGHFVLGVLYLWGLMCLGAGEMRIDEIRREIDKSKAQAFNGSVA